MKSLKIPEINFVDQKTKDHELKIENEIAIQSPRTLAYVVRWQLARNRSGSAKTKTMSEISGTTAKPWKQKGTGRARQGSRRSVQFVGGRTCHGPTPRSFDFSMPKKIAKIAINDAIISKLSENRISILAKNDNLKTTIVNKYFQKNQINSALIILDKENQQLDKPFRNIKNTKVILNNAINALDILNYDHVIIDNDTFKNKIMGVIK